MLLYIDQREGSKRFLDVFKGESESVILPAGDFAFFGNGPDEAVWYIGIEHKQVDDVVHCIKDGRFAGSQLPGMLQLYDMSFLLVEGNYQPDMHNLDQSGQPRLWVPYRAGNGQRFGMSYQAFDNYLTAVSIFTALDGKPCIVLRSKGFQESEQIIRDIYSFFQKPWDKHVSMQAMNSNKMQRVQREIDIINVEPNDPNYPRYILRRSLYQVAQIGWKQAGLLSDAYITMEILMTAGQQDFESIEGIGPTLAKRLFETLHGRADDTIRKRVRKKVE